MPSYTLQDDHGGLNTATRCGNNSKEIQILGHNLIGEIIGGGGGGGNTYGHLCPLKATEKHPVHLSRESLFQWSFWFRFLILARTQFT